MYHHTQLSKELCLYRTSTVVILGLQSQVPLSTDVSLGRGSFSCTHTGSCLVTNKSCARLCVQPLPSFQTPSSVPTPHPCSSYRALQLPSLQPHSAYRASLLPSGRL